LLKLSANSRYKSQTSKEIRQQIPDKTLIYESTAGVLPGKCKCTCFSKISPIPCCNNSRARKFQKVLRVITSYDSRVDDRVNCFHRSVITLSHSVLLSTQLCNGKSVAKLSRTKVIFNRLCVQFIDSRGNSSKARSQSYFLLFSRTV
jgi:hypothetical protein